MCTIDTDQVEQAPCAIATLAGIDVAYRRSRVAQQAIARLGAARDEAERAAALADVRRALAALDEFMGDRLEKATRLQLTDPGWSLGAALLVARTLHEARLAATLLDILAAEPPQLTTE